jgi:hypothetical protein
MKYQYRLIKENDEEEVSGLKGLKTQSELILTTLGDYTAKDIINIIKDPKNLEKVYTKETTGFDELELKVFGDRPAANPTLKTNIEIYKENGKALYSKIEDTVGEKFDKRGAEIRKDKAGNTLFVFPKKNIQNKELVEKYFNLTSGEQAKKADLRPKEIDDFTLKFPLIDGPDLKKILNNAELESGKDYKLTKQEITNENLYKVIKEEILKFYKK